MPRPRPGRPLHRKQGRPRGRVPVYFFVEGKTEEDYIRHLHGLTDEFRLIPQLQSSNRSLLVKSAIELRQSDIRVPAERRDPMLGPRAWCVFDFDDDVSVDSLLQRARKDGVGVAFSYPCLELWLLLHFKLVSGQPDKDAIVEKLRTVDPAFRDWGKQGARRKRLTGTQWTALSKRYETAKLNSLQLVSRCPHGTCTPPQHDEKCVPSKRNPSCNIFELIDSLKITY